MEALGVFASTFPLSVSVEILSVFGSADSRTLPNVEYIEICPRPKHWRDQVPYDRVKDRENFDFHQW